jgi:hypothetical protein
MADMNDMLEVYKYLNVPPDTTPRDFIRKARDFWRENIYMHPDAGVSERTARHAFYRVLMNIHVKVIETAMMVTVIAAATGEDPRVIINSLI